MLGAIIGDIVGSPYERHNLKRTDFELFSPECRFTDDTVLSIATAVALMDGVSYAEAYRSFARRFPHIGWGPQFNDWVWNDNAGPYGSFGNGAAMRVSPVAYGAHTMEAVLAEAARSAVVTHNHPEGIRGAQATAGAVFLAMSGSSKDEIKQFWLNNYSYRLTSDLVGLQRQNRFDATCEGTLPVVFSVVLAAESFEHCLRLAVSMGGDSDTIAAIAGSIAEPMFGIPSDLKLRVEGYLPSELIEEIQRFEKWAAVKRAGLKPGTSGRSYPYVVVRWASCVYGTRAIKFLSEVPNIEAPDQVTIIDPAPFDEDGRLSEGSKERIIQKVRTLVAASGFRMCVVFGDRESVFIEVDGSLIVSTTAPSGGLQIDQMQVDDPKTPRH